MNENWRNLFFARFKVEAYSQYLNDFINNLEGLVETLIQCMEKRSVTSRSNTGNAGKYGINFMFFYVSIIILLKKVLNP